MKVESMVQGNELCFRAGRWLTPRWVAYEHIHQINTRRNSLRAWIPGIRQLKLLQTIPPKCNWKTDYPFAPSCWEILRLKVDRQLFWMWDSQLQLALSPVVVLHWVQVLATGTGDCCAIPSGGQEQQGPGHSSEWAGKWTFAVRVHYPAFQQ